MMKAARFRWVILALFFIVVALPIVGFVRDAVLPPPADNVAWVEDFDAATAQAKASNRPMLVNFTASWCPPCKVMKRSTWPDARVGKLLSEKFVPVRMDVDVPKNRPVGQHYAVMDIPTILVLEPDGSFREVGSFMSADEMVKFLDRQAPVAATTQP